MGSPAVQRNLGGSHGAFPVSGLWLRVMVKGLEFRVMVKGYG